MHLVLLEQFVMQDHDLVHHNEPHEAHVFRVSMGQESVDPVYPDVAFLPLVLNFIAWDSDG